MGGVSGFGQVARAAVSPRISQVPVTTSENLFSLYVTNVLPVGLAIAQFQKPWPVESLIPAGIFAAAAATAILYKTLNRRIH